MSRYKSVVPIPPQVKQWEAEEEAEREAERLKRQAFVNVYESRLHADLALYRAKLIAQFPEASEDRP